MLSLGLLGTGVWLREQRGAYEAALAAAAVGIAGSFGTLFVAGPVYDLVPRDVALLGALVTGGRATRALDPLARAGDGLARAARRALGAGACSAAVDGSEHVFLLIAYAATIAVLVWRRWTLLAGFAFASATLAVGRVRGRRAASCSRSCSTALLAAALAFGFEANRRGLHRVEIGPEARTRPSWFAASACS